ncbi:MAG: 30S ribosomal protein S17 [Candidatus Woesebacteria bacterium GW2011_GWA1_45_8]|uniref:Small ribosomal subunit protein uS17 n=1 Tax=Candidatus Woesebacteria bacterium GW2011_GWA1_45_8 TaxID=1618559 RepID=A0A0G1Q3P3_9BACT|nr:MAG: 30S ribosomal protein S17 [Candidatus Woesebacteria bacterium GW2011_GWA1_45_8]
MKIFLGKVISVRGLKTATVSVERTVTHPVYLKRFKRAKKYHVHDEIGVKLGDTVKFATSAPISKLKKWKIIEVVIDKKQGTKKKGK